MSLTYFYDEQFKNILSQFTRIFSDIKYKTGYNRTGGRELLPVLCQVGNVSRLAGSAAIKNSTNTALYAPMISCWISNIDVDRRNTRNPTHIESLQVNEKEYDYSNGKYLPKEGSKYTLERYSPIPYAITLQADIWSTNEDMKMQILEQILMLFNPSVALQKNNNPLDSTTQMDVELTGINYSSRNVPVGTDDGFEITSLTFSLQHFYLNTPAKLKKQETIQNIFTNVGFDQPENEIILWKSDDYFQTIETYKNLELNVIGDELKLVSYGQPTSWSDLFSAISQQFEEKMFYIRLMPNYKNMKFTTDDILIRLDSLSSLDDNIALGTLNKNTLPSPNIEAINDVIDPSTIFPDFGLEYTAGSRFFITRDITPNTIAWGALSAVEGSIIQCDEDGVNWSVVFDPLEQDAGFVVRNLADNEVYVNVDKGMLISVYQGTYRPASWRIVTVINKNISN